MKEVWYRYPQGDWKVYFARGEPFVETKPVNTASIKCYRADGTGTDYRLYELFFCAAVATFQVVRSFKKAPACWRFFGTGTNGWDYETFAAGESPSYYSHVYFQHEGTVVSPMIDGNLFMGLDWRYWPPGGIQEVSSSKCSVSDQKALVGVFADGNRIPSSDWVYLEEKPHSIVEVEEISRRSNRVSAGDCNCPGELNCEFTILVDGQKKFSLTEETCPEWQIKEQQCPPDTCECRHSNRVCCYNRNGNLVKSFLT
ncbi:MAG: hypothetical protein RH949_13275 [Coleofasciculus sp. A1-SPW-01]|uniref:hypothetical protein n=1 Tax=Coleofasciculus sp. A1-SPW-01 TaxID=3070819 RepID=UPI0032FFDB15